MKEPFRGLGMPHQYMTSHLNHPVGICFVPGKYLIQHFLCTGIVKNRNLYFPVIYSICCHPRASAAAIIKKCIRLQFVAKGYGIKMSGDNLPYLLIFDFRRRNRRTGHTAHFFFYAVTQNRNFHRFRLRFCFSLFFFFGSRRIISRVLRNCFLGRYLLLYLARIGRTPQN